MRTIKITKDTFINDEHGFKNDFIRRKIKNRKSQK